MVLVAVLMGYVCLVGLTARRFDTQVRWLLLAGIIALAAFDLARRLLT